MHTTWMWPCITHPPPGPGRWQSTADDPKRPKTVSSQLNHSLLHRNQFHGNRPIMCSMDDNHVDVIRDIDSGCADNNISGSQGSSSLITACVDNNVSRSQASFPLIVLYSPESSVSCSCSLVKRLFLLKTLGNLSTVDGKDKCAWEMRFNWLQMRLDISKLEKLEKLEKLTFWKFSEASSVTLIILYLSGSWDSYLNISNSIQKLYVSIWEKSDIYK